MSEPEETPEVAETTEETPADETTPETGAAPEVETEGEPKAEEKPKDDKPPSLKAAIRMERKAKEIRAAAEAKAADVERREAALRADVERWQGERKAWEAQVQPQLQQLQQIRRAAKEGRYGDLFGALGLDPRAVLEGHASELQTPEPLNRELQELRAFRQRFEEQESQRKAQEEQQQKLAAARSADFAAISQEVAFNDDLGHVRKYTREVGKDAFLDEVYAIHGQLKEARRDTSLPSLLAEIERRARIHYGNAEPKSAAPSQGKGPGQPAAPAAPNANPAGRKPVGISQRAAAETAGTDEEWSPEELDRRAAERLRRRKAS